MKTILATCVALTVAGGAFAQSANLNNNAQSQSGALSGSSSAVTIEGAQIPDNTPGLGGLVGSAGNCYPGGAAQAVGPGFGLGIGGGRVDPECNIRMEMQAIAAVHGKRAAMLHACMHDESMRRTLMAVGACKPVGEQPAVASASVKGTVMERPTVVTKQLYTRCERQADGRIAVGVRSGLDAASKRLAVQQCRNSL